MSTVHIPSFIQRIALFHSVLFHWHLEHAHHQFSPYHDSPCELLLLLLMKNHLITYRLEKTWRKYINFLHNGRHFESLNRAQSDTVTQWNFDIYCARTLWAIEEKKLWNFHIFRTIIVSVSQFWPFPLERHWTMPIDRKCLSLSLYIWCSYLARVGRKFNLKFTHRFDSDFFRLIFFTHSLFVVSPAEAQSLTNTIHKTQAAAERPNDMWCYACHSMDSGDKCVENITANYSSFLKKCKDDEFICMVQKFSYTTSTENATSSARMWSLERKCAAACEAGCIVIGERTKLYACTSCCRTSYCNIDRGGAKYSTRPAHPVETVLISLFVMTLAKFLLAEPMLPNFDCWHE